MFQQHFRDIVVSSFIDVENRRKFPIRRKVFQIDLTMDVLFFFILCILCCQFLRNIKEKEQRLVGLESG
jgi:hypothetical protein